jgi:hypothetical protein
MSRMPVIGNWPAAQVDQNRWPDGSTKLPGNE